MTKKCQKLKAFTFHGSAHNILNMNPKSFSQLTNEDISKINSVAKNEIQYFDYPLIAPDNFNRENYDGIQ